MTKQRYLDIENAVLVGLLEATEHGEDPFKVDTDIFTTQLKKKIATTINKYIDDGEAYMAMYKFINAVDEDPILQDEWIHIQEKTYNILPVSTIKRYYDDLIVEYKAKIAKETR